VFFWVAAGGEKSGRDLPEVTRIHQDSHAYESSQSKAMYFRQQKSSIFSTAFSRIYSRMRREIFLCVIENYCLRVGNIFPFG
jgi:hypothetical protein